MQLLSLFQKTVSSGGVGLLLSRLSWYLTQYEEERKCVEGQPWCRSGNSRGLPISSYQYHHPIGQQQSPMENHLKTTWRELACSSTIKMYVASDDPFPYCFSRVQTSVTEQFPINNWSPYKTVSSHKAETIWEMFQNYYRMSKSFIFCIYYSQTSENFYHLIVDVLSPKGRNRQPEKENSGIRKKT